MEMELETGPAAPGTESKDLCATISALAYPSSAVHMLSLKSLLLDVG